MNRFPKTLKHLVSVLLLLAMVFSSPVLPRYAAAEDYDPLDHGIRNGGDVTDNVTVANRIDQILREFPVGSYFSKTGKPCTCHGKCDWLHDGCECISVYDDPETGKEVWLYSIQCMGFSHMCFYKIFGFMGTTAYPNNASKYYSLGSLSTSEMTVSNVKKLFSKAKTGADIRVKGHSMVFLKQDEDYIWILQANWDSPCLIDMRKWSWEDFTARYKNKGVEYVYMPVDYPASSGTYVPPTDLPEFEEPTYVAGKYEVTASNSGLRLREGPGTSYSQLALIPDGTVVTVTEVSNGWGKTSYNGSTGWIALQYTEFVDPTLPALRITVSEDRTYVYVGTVPDFSGITVTKVLTDQTTQVLSPSQYTVTYSAPAPGNYTAVVTADGLTAAFDLIVLPYGDVNGDGTVTAADAMLIQRGGLTARQKEGADTNGDGSVTVADAQRILDYLTGRVSGLPAKEG